MQKKLKLRVQDVKNLLSRDEMKNVLGGVTGSSSTGSAIPCQGGTGGYCRTRDGRDGTCTYYMGIYGCVPN